MFKGERSDVLTWDAQKLLNDMKEEDILVSDGAGWGVYEEDTFVGKITVDRWWRGYGVWIAKNRMRQ